jgi:hypothetical protein
MPHPPPRPPTLTKADVAAFRALVAESAKRRVRARALRWIGKGVWAVVLALLTWGLNHYSVKRNDETRYIHHQETARVEKKLDKVEEVTKALAPEAFSSKMTNK